MTTTSPISIRFPGEAGGRIMPVPLDLRLEAASRLVAAGGRSDLVAGRRFLHDAEVNDIPLDRFWCWMEPTGRVEAAVLAVKSPGRTALVFASRPAGLGRAEKVARTLDFACRALAAEGVVIAQGLLEPGERAERKVFHKADFQLLAQLTYMQRSLRDAPPREVNWPSGAMLETYSADNHRDFLRALDDSYIETLDCPALSGVRSAEDILAGHRATGEFDPSFWTLLRLEGRPSGVLLMNPSPRQSAVELVYIGLAKGARGRSLGRKLLEHGIRQASARPEPTLTLAVDDRNAAAGRLYRDSGFRRVFRRIALLRNLAVGGTGRE